MKKQHSWKTYAVELSLYALVVASYYFLVLHMFGGWFKELFDHDRRLFAVVALLTMIGQAVGLEFINSGLVWLLSRGKK